MIGATMSQYQPQLEWIDQQRDRMCQLVTQWANINSDSHNVGGLNLLAKELKREFAVLGGERVDRKLLPYASITSDGREIMTPLGDAIAISKRPNAPIKVFLGIHMDTVYEPDHPFQSVQRIDENTLRGPGVIDAKGGLCVMLIALQAFEQFPLAGKIGWEILINPDEEIASPGSAPLLVESAKRNHFGMVYEPALPDGNLVGERKGSGNFTAIIRGKSAHVGRDFSNGRNAIHAAAALVVALDEINRSMPGVIVNVGRIDGGGPANIVPDMAIVRFNMRVSTREEQRKIESELQRVVTMIDSRDGIRLELKGGFSSPPKPMDDATTRLFEKVIGCGRDLGLNLTWRATGGVSDGNKLAAAGLPVIDSLGPRGGGMHSPDEFLLLDSLTERAKLSALLLMKIASGEA